MEFNIAEIITIAVFVGSCAGYIKREIVKITKKQEKQLEENNQQIDKMQKEMASTKKITEAQLSLIESLKTAMVIQNRSMTERIDSISKRLD